MDVVHTPTLMVHKITLDNRGEIRAACYAYWEVTGNVRVVLTCDTACTG